MDSCVRRSSLRLALVAALGLVALPETSEAAWLAYTGDLEIGLGGTGSAVSFSFAGSGSAVLNGSGPAGGHLNTLALSASPFATTGLTVPLTDPNIFPVAGIQATVHNGAGAFAGGAGVMPLFGVAKICIFYPCASTPINNVSVPLNVVGVGGVATQMGAVNVTVVGGPWTTGTAAVGTITKMGFAHGPNGFTSSTAQGSGVIQLVTPIFVSTSIGSFAVVPFFATLTLHFVPEPGTFGLLAGGLGALALGGRQRMRRH